MFPDRYTKEWSGLSAVREREVPREQWVRPDGTALPDALRVAAAAR
jgi:hypothetical protein